MLTCRPADPTHASLTQPTQFKQRLSCKEPGTQMASMTKWCLRLIRDLAYIQNNWNSVEGTGGCCVQCRCVNMGDLQYFLIPYHMEAKERKHYLLNVNVIWRIIAYVLSQAILVKYIWSRSLRTLYRSPFCPRCVSNAFHFRYTHVTVDERISTIPIISEIECHIRSKTSIIPHLHSSYYE